MSVLHCLGEGQGPGAVGCGIFSLWMNFDSLGESGGLVMRDGPEMIVFVCVCGVGSVYGLEKGKFICVLIGQMCCLLCLSCDLAFLCSMTLASELDLSQYLLSMRSGQLG